MTAPTIPEGYVLVPIEPDHGVIKAMAESRATDDEGEFPAMFDLLDFSGENKTHAVLRAAYVAAVAAAPAIPLPAAPVQGWQPIETAPKDMASRLYLVGRYCVQGFTDAAGELNVQSEVSPHWRKMRAKPTHWMPLPPPPVGEKE